MKKYPAAIQLSLCTAMIVFAASLITLGCYYVAPDGYSARTGLVCMIIFGILNIPVLIVLTAGFITGHVKAKQWFFSAVAQLINIPFALLCMWWIEHYLTKILI